jgi:hypothetical protein
VSSLSIFTAWPAGTLVTHFSICRVYQRPFSASVVGKIVFLVNLAKFFCLGEQRVLLYFEENEKEISLHLETEMKGGKMFLFTEQIESRKPTRIIELIYIVAICFHFVTFYSNKQGSRLNTKLLL